MPKPKKGLLERLFGWSGKKSTDLPKDSNVPDDFDTDSDDEKAPPSKLPESDKSGKSEGSGYGLRSTEDQEQSSPLVTIVGSREPYPAADSDPYAKPGIHRKLLPTQRKASYPHPLDKLREKHSILVTPSGNKYLLMHTFDKDEWESFIAEYQQYTHAGKPHKNKDGREDIKFIGGEGNQGIFRIAREINPTAVDRYELGDYQGMKKTRSIPNDPNDDPEKVNEAEKEAKLVVTGLMKNRELANVIVPSRDYIKTENTKGTNTVYLLMPIAKRGVDFAKGITRQTERDQLILKAANQLLGAVATLHSYGVYHGDLKLDNTFVIGGQFKLGDFGAAKVGLDKVSEKFATNYATPEHYFSSHRSSSEEYDSWATGLMLLELCGANIAAAFSKANFNFFAEIKPVHDLWRIAAEISSNRQPLTLEQEKEFGIKLPSTIVRSNIDDLMKAQRDALYARAADMLNHLKGKPIYQHMINDLINNTNIPDALKPTISHLLDFNREQRFSVTEALHLFQNTKNNENWLLENPNQNIETTKAEDLGEDVAHTKLLITAELLKKIEKDNSNKDENNKDKEGKPKPKDSVFYLNIQPKDIVVNKEGHVKIAAPSVNEDDLLLFKLHDMEDYIYCPPEILFFDENLVPAAASAWSLGITLLKLYDVELSQFTKKIIPFAESLKNADSLADALRNLNHQLAELDMEIVTEENSEKHSKQQKNIKDTIAIITAQHGKLLNEMAKSTEAFQTLITDILENKLNNVPEPVKTTIKSLLAYDVNERATVSQALTQLRMAAPDLFVNDQSSKELVRLTTDHRREQLQIEAPIDNNFAFGINLEPPTGERKGYGGIAKNPEKEEILPPAPKVTVVQKNPVVNAEPKYKGYGTTIPRNPEIEDSETTVESTYKGYGTTIPHNPEETTVVNSVEVSPVNTPIPPTVPKKVDPMDELMEAIEKNHPDLSLNAPKKNEDEARRQEEIRRREEEEVKSRREERIGFERIASEAKKDPVPTKPVPPVSLNTQPPAPPVVEKKNPAPSFPSPVESGSITPQQQVADLLRDISQGLSQTAMLISQLTMRPEKAAMGSYYGQSSSALYHQSVATSDKNPASSMPNPNGKPTKNHQ